MPSSITSAPACGQPEQDLLRGLEVGIAGGDEGDEALAAFLLQLGEAAIDARLFCH